VFKAAVVMKLERCQRYEWHCPGLDWRNV